MYPSLKIVALIIGLVITAIFLLELFVRWKRRPFLRYLRSFRMPSYYIPIIGHGPVLFGAPEKLIRKIEDFYWTYQKENFIALLGHRVFLITCKPEDIALAVGSPNFINKTVEYTVLQDSIMGQGLFSTTDLSEWKKNRKLINPAFKHQVVKSFVNNFYVEAKILADKLIQSMERDGEVEVFEPTGLCTMAMVLQNTMGVSVDAQKNSDHIFIRSLDTVMKVWHERFARPWNLSKFVFNFSSMKSKHDAAMREIQAFATEIILIKLQERLQKLTTAGIKTDGQIMSNGKDDDDCGLRKPKVFLDLLIEYVYYGVDEHNLRRAVQELRKVSNRRGNPNNAGNNQNGGCKIRSSKNADSSLKKKLENLKSVINYIVASFRKITDIPKNKASAKSSVEADDNESKEPREVRLKIAELQHLNEQLRDEMITIMIGGQETTANENSFAILMLAMHQEAQKKVVLELDEIFGDDRRAPSIEDLQRMRYLECVIKETLRLYPALPVVGRDAEKDIMLSDNTLVVKGSSVVFFIYGIHRDERNFPDPTRFLPERFLPENSVDRHPYCFLPFFAGARNCIGYKYAMLQMKTILSTLVREFHILPSERMPDKNHIQLQLSSTLRPVGGCWVKLEKRFPPTKASWDTNINEKIINK